MSPAFFRGLKKVDSRILAVMIFAAAVAWIAPLSLALDQHGDEMMYAYRGGYYMKRLVNLDFSGPGPDAYSDPGFAPFSFHSLDTPFGSNFFYAVVYFLTGIDAPSKPFAYGEGIFNGPETRISENSLPVLRLSAVLAAAGGLALITLRFRWRGAVACLLFLVLPYARRDFALAWSEGPLLLGFGLCAAAYGTRWFPIAAAAAGAFKLNGIMAWPLLLVPLAGGKAKPGRERRKILTNMLTTAFVWAFFTPQSWLAGGPLYLLLMIYVRVGIYQHQVGVYDGFLPTRYLWPLVLAALLLVLHLPQVVPWVRSIRRKGWKQPYPAI